MLWTFWKFELFILIKNFWAWERAWVLLRVFTCFWTFFQSLQYNKMPSRNLWCSSFCQRPEWLSSFSSFDFNWFIFMSSKCDVSSEFLIVIIFLWVEFFWSLGKVELLRTFSISLLKLGKLLCSLQQLLVSASFSTMKYILRGSFCSFTITI